MKSFLFGIALWILASIVGLAWSFWILGEFSRVNRPYGHTDLVGSLAYSFPLLIAWWAGGRIPLRPPRWIRWTIVHLVVAVVAIVGWNVVFRQGVILLCESWRRELLLGRVYSEFSFIEDVIGLGSWGSLGRYSLGLAIRTAFETLRSLRRERRRHARTQSDLTRARLAMLEAQIQPHFLFNALNAISALVRTQDGERAQAMLANLARLLRSSTEDGTEGFATIGAELDALEAYVALERCRFGDRDVRWEVEVHDELRDESIPRWILQPIVENAFQHAIEERDDAGRVRLQIRRDDTRVELRVDDDGPGTSASSLDELSLGRGLGTTFERLATLYGERFERRIERSVFGGTCIVLRFPRSAIPSEAVA